MQKSAPADFFVPAARAGACAILAAMNLASSVLPAAFYWIGYGMFVPLLAFAAYRAPWHRVRHGMLHVYLGTAVALIIMWLMKAGLTPGLHYHLLGGTLLTLMFGWELALVAVTGVLAAVTANGMGDWTSFALNGLIMGAIPVLLTQAVFVLAVRFLPHHFFIYVIVNAFLCGGLAMAASVGISAFLLSHFSVYTRHELVGEFLLFAPLMVFAEAFFSGMLASGMALMKPEWIVTFDDRRYLAGK